MPLPGMLFGEFDPVDNDIVQIARSAIESGYVSDVTLVPCDLPGRRPAASLDNRVEMVRIAVRGFQNMHVSTECVPDMPAFLRAGQPPALASACREAITFIYRADELAVLAGKASASVKEGCQDILIIPCPGVDAGALVESIFGSGAKVRILNRLYNGKADEAVKSMSASFEDPAGAIDPDVIAYIALNGLYLPDFASQVSNMISPKRYRHTLGVRETAVRLGRRYGAPLVRSAVAGLLHDCAKDMPLSGMRAAVRDSAFADTDMLESGALLHGPAGACIARTEFGVSDPAILSAIACHTVGRTGMTPLDLCLFVADAIEPGRSDYPGLKEIRALAQKDLRRAALLSMQCTREYVLEKGEPYSRTTLSAMKDLTDRIKEEN